MEHRRGIVVASLVALSGAVGSAAEFGVRDFVLRDIEVPAGSIPESFRTRVEHEGRPLTLVLHRRPVRAPSFRLLVQSPDGTLRDAVPAPERTYRGIIEEEP